jgi:hypothetical protein
MISKIRIVSIYGFKKYLIIIKGKETGTEYCYVHRCILDIKWVTVSEGT